MTVLGSIKSKDFKPQWLAQCRLSCNQCKRIATSQYWDKTQTKRRQKKIQQKSPEDDDDGDNLWLQ